MSPLPYVHIFTPLILLPPLLALFPKPQEPVPQVPGLRPITIRRVIPRRFVILTVLILLAITSFLDAALLVADLLTSPSRDGGILADNKLSLDAWVVYSVGGVLIWGLTAIAAEYRARWGDKAIIVLATLAFVCEIPNLALLAVGVSHAHGYWAFFPILALVPPCLRLLLLPVLFVAVATPRIIYEPADETSPLTNGGNEEGADVARGRDAYGTFNESSPASRDQSVHPQTGSSTPGTNAKNGVKIPNHIKIPKQLGETRKEDPPIELKVVLGRMRKLAPYLWPSTSRKLQFYVFICFLLLVAGRILQPLIPLSLGQVVRVLTQSAGGRPGPSIWPPFIAYFAIRVLISGSGLILFIRQRLWIPVAQYSDREMMMLCFNHLLNLSLSYHTRRNTGEVLKIIDRGSAINNLFQVVLFTAFPTICDMFIAYGLFFYLYGPVLAGVSLVVMILYLILAVTATSRRTRLRRELRDRDIKQRGIISDVLTNWESVKYFTAERRERDRFQTAVVSYQEAEARWQATYQVVYLVQSLLITLGLMSGALMIAFRVLRGESDAAEFVVFIQYFAQLSGPLDRLGSLYQQLNRDSIDAEKMFALLAETTEVSDQPDATELVVTNGVIEFDNVKFSYDGKVPALKGVSFKIDKGQSMALVSESGSGKSTILRLLYRFYDVDSGVIRIDGQDISKVTQTSLRKAIGIVPQDSVLWNDTIGANISYGKEGATDEEIIVAAQAAKLHDRILSFSDGYSTIVGERGIRLSGGEKQRVSLARMFLKSPAILVLDEATSALDTETEREIQRALADLAEGRTSLSIAHRLSTIINSDKIVVMKDGEVIENGGYKDLLELDGVFAGMWKKQIFTEEEMLAGATKNDKDLIDFDPVDPKGRENLMDQEADFTFTRDDTPQSGPSGTSSQSGSAPGGDATADTAVTANSAETIKVGHDAVVAEADQDKPTGTKAETRPEEGYEVDHQPETYAEAVKVNLPEESQGQIDRASEQSEHAPENGSSTSKPESAAPAAEDTKNESKEAGGAAEGVSAAEPSTTPSKSNRSTGTNTTRHSVALPTTEGGTTTPDKRLSLPPMPRMTSSQSTTSILSAASGSTSPSLTPTGEAPSEDSKSDKRKKRLSQIRGFVRRISDQGITRSPSLGGKGKSPMGELDEATAMAGGSRNEDNRGKDKDEKRKKRLSLKM